MTYSCQYNACDSGTCAECVRDSNHDDDTWSCECCCYSELEHEALYAKSYAEFSWMLDLKRGAPSPTWCPDVEDVEASEIKNGWREMLMPPKPQK